MEFTEALHESAVHVRVSLSLHLRECCPHVAPVDEISRVCDGGLHSWINVFVMGRGVREHIDRIDGLTTGHFLGDIPR